MTIRKGTVCFIVLGILIGLVSFGQVSVAEKSDEPKVLVIYSSSTGEVDEHQRSLDMIISHFTTDITFINSNEVKKDDLTDVTHLFYYGQIAEQLPNSFTALFDEYSGFFVAIGYNSEQLGDQFTFVNPLHERGIDQLILTNNKEKKLKSVPQEIIDIELGAGSEVLIEGKRASDTTSYPVMVKKGDRYFYGVDIIWSHESALFGEVLHDIFEVDHKNEHPAYIRLEDVHPLVDPKNLEDIAKVLKEKDIPYMIAVIPVYTDPETGEEIHFSDSPKLLKVLKEMQKDGGSIVLHGYTHQFRSSETGEGFEFWDVERNTPIYAPAYEEFTLKKVSEFPTKKDYEDYIDNLKEFEREYIEKKLTTGIQELVNYGLYPLAFEAPHYTMSQNGYKVTSEYFSTYVGQIQLSDEDWERMDSTPYITSPSFLNGMKLLPETMGYVEPGDPEAIQKMLDRAEIMSMTKDGMLSAFYHPYLGVEGFEKLINEMEHLPNLSWIDLKEMDVWINADKVSIHTEKGQVKVDVNRGELIVSSVDFLLYHLFRLINVIAWGMAVIGTAAVLLFVMFTFSNYGRKRKMEGEL